MCTIVVRTKAMRNKIINMIIQFLFIRIAKFEFQLEEDGNISVKMYLDDDNIRVNTIVSCYGIIGFVKPFNKDEEWEYIGRKFAIPFMSMKKFAIEKIKTKVRLKNRKICKNCLFYISKDNTCGKDIRKSNLRTFPFKKEMKCFVENI